MSVLCQRPPVLGGDILADKLDKDVAWNSYRQLIHILFETDTGAHLEHCPMSDHYAQVLSILRSMPASDPTTHEAWLLLYPLLAEHPVCDLCRPLADDWNGTVESTGIHRRVIWEAARLVDSIHVTLVSPDAFVPPVLCVTRTFMAACVLVTGVRNEWPGVESCTKVLLKCSEILAFTSRLWDGGREYFEVYRRITATI